MVFDKDIIDKIHNGNLIHIYDNIGLKKIKDDEYNRNIKKMK